MGTQMPLLLLGVLFIPLLGVFAWQLAAFFRRQGSDTHTGRGDGLLLALLALAAFGLGVFLTFIIMGSIH
jgi:hypothetical protein